MDSHRKVRKLLLLIIKSIGSPDSKFINMLYVKACDTLSVPTLCAKGYKYGDLLVYDESHLTMKYSVEDV